MVLSLKKFRVLFFGWVLLILMYRFFSGLLIHQWGLPLQFDPFIDFTMWIVSWSGINSLIVETKMGSILFDVLLVGVTVVNIFSNKKLFSYLFTLLFVLYVLLFNMYSTSHGHNMLAIIFISPLFFIGSDKFKAYTWMTIRYYVIYVYVTAFIWKILRSSLWQFDYAQIILYINNYENLYIGNSVVAHFLLSNPTFSYLIIISGVLLEGLFIVGLFTLKFDKYLFFFVLCFHFASYILFDIYFFPFMIAACVFLPFNIKDKSYLTYIST